MSKRLIRISGLLSILIYVCATMLLLIMFFLKDSELELPEEVLIKNSFNSLTFELLSYEKYAYTETMSKFNSYLQNRNISQEGSNLNTYYRLINTTVNTSSGNEISFELENAEKINITFKAKIQVKESGILQFNIENAKPNINNLPELSNSNFTQIKFTNDYFEVYLENSLNSSRLSYLQNNVLGSDQTFNQAVLRVFYDPFYFDYFINQKETNLENELVDTRLQSNTNQSNLNLNKYMTLKLVTIEDLITVETIHYMSEEVWGLAERMSDFKLKDNQYRLFNIDRINHEPGSVESLYGSFPMVYNKHNKSELRNTNLISAFLIENPSEGIVDLTTIRINKETNLTNLSGSSFLGSNNNDYLIKHFIWRFNTGNFNCYFFADDHSKTFYKNGKVTGFNYLPPLFSIGFHFSRWGYSNIEDAMENEAGFTSHNIPIDVVWFDIEHTDSYHYFTWNPANFTTTKVKSFVNNLSNKKRKLVTIADPHFSTNSTYKISRTLAEQNLLVINGDKFGGRFIGNCWPGESYYADYFNPEISLFYKNTIFKDESYFLNADNIFTWVDMNEPSVFGALDFTLPPNSLHNTGREYIAHREVHNIYGQQYHKVVFESLQERYKNKRPFVLSRSTYFGSQQYGFHWTGDNTSRWDHIKYSLHMIMTLNVLGMNNVGADVGGFFDTPTEELLAFWYEVGVFYPFFRAHSYIMTKRMEPWKLSNQNLSRVQTAVMLRYHLILFFYTQAYISSQTNSPNVFPYLNSDHLYTYGKEFIFQIKMDRDIDDDPSILYGRRIYNFKTGLLINDVSKLNTLSNPSESFSIYINGGSIISWIEKAQISTDFTFRNPISIMIYPDESGNASGFLFVDDGESYDYKNTEDYILTHFTLKDFSVIKSSVIHLPYISQSKTYFNKIDWIFLYGFSKQIAEEILLKQHENRNTVIAQYLPEENKYAINLASFNLDISKEFELIVELKK